MDLQSWSVKKAFEKSRRSLDLFETLLMFPQLPGRKGQVIHNLFHAVPSLLQSNCNELFTPSQITIIALG